MKIALFLLSFFTPFGVYGYRGSPRLATQSSPEDCQVATSKDLFDAKAPRFSAYSVKGPEKVSDPKVDIQTSEMGRKFRTVLTQGVKEGPNFAGHYRVVAWGCGSSCLSFAVVNLITGQILQANGLQTISFVRFETSDFLPTADAEYTGLRFRSDSKLLVVVGAPNEEDAKAGVFYYRVHDERLELIHFTPVQKRCSTSR